MAQMYCSKRYRDQLKVKSQKRCIQRWVVWSWRDVHVIRLMCRRQMVSFHPRIHRFGVLSSTVTQLEPL
jgi:hypothetical protein